MEGGGWNKGDISLNTNFTLRFSYLRLIFVQFTLSLVGFVAESYLLEP